MKNTVRYLVIIVTLCLLQSCKSYKYVFSPSSEEIISNRAKALENIIMKDELFLVFTVKFKNDKVKVIENGKTTYDGLMTTKDKGKAEVLKININSKLNIVFDGIKDTLKITNDQMKLYKYIYLSKNNKKCTVEFSNGGKDLGSLPLNQ